MLYEMWIIKSSVVAQQAYDQLSEQEKQDFQGKLIEAHNAAHATQLVTMQGGWANEASPYWGLNMMPDLDARLTLYNKMLESGLFRFVEGMTLLGSSDQQWSLPTYDAPVYLLWMLHTDPGSIMARKALTPDELTQLHEREHASFDRNGGCEVLTCDSYWANEAYAAFGVEAFPSLEALRAYKDDLLQLDWARFYPGESVLGLPMGYPYTGQGG